MNLTNQISALQSLNKDLIPASNLLDSRTHQDRLAFMVEFASLINFYDKDNTVNGDWSPFLLKDPIFLLAFIAKTPFDTIHSLFVATNLNLQQSIIINKDIQLTSRGFNEVFSQLTKVFLLMERWTYYMLQNTKVYTLKNYVLTQIEEQYSLWLWSILELKQQLFLTDYIPSITQVDSYSFQNFDPKTWNQSKGNTTYWEVLKLQPILTDNSFQKIYESLNDIGSQLMSFFKGIIEYAVVELDSEEIQNNSYPDTLLLRTFSKLLENHTQQINGLSAKHLDFYYATILKQQQNLAQPDTVFVTASLAKTNNVFTLPQNTVFNAGKYSDGEAVLFENATPVSLNSAVISNAYTLCKNTTKKSTKLYFKKQEKVNTLKKDEEEKIEKWKTFGSTLVAEDQVVNQGISIASPMFFLKEGERSLILTFTFLEEVAINFIKGGTFFLSTLKGWYQIPEENLLITPILDSKEITFTISLDVEAPAIEAFSKTTDGIDSKWPIFKMLFSEFENIASPPKISMLQIEVDVTGLKTFNLYNDYGLLEVKKPFQPLGPTPNKDQSFIIGNAEVFSKPVAFFQMDLDWNNLPPDFRKYYEQYNQYINKFYNKPIKDGDTLLENEPPQPTVETNNVSTSPDTASKEKKRWGIFSGFSKKKAMELPLAVTPEDDNDVFTNTSFNVNFQYLQNGTWNPLVMDYSGSILEIILYVQKIKIDDKKILNLAPNLLFQGVFELDLFLELHDTNECLAAVLFVDSTIKTASFLSIEDQLNIQASVIVKNQNYDLDQLKIKELLKIEESALLSNLVEVNDQLELKEFLKEEPDITLKEVLEIKELIKLKDLLLINNTFTIVEISQLDTTLGSEDTLSFPSAMVLENQPQIKDSLTISDVFEFDDQIKFKESLNTKLKDVFKIKKDLKIKDLFTETSQFNFQGSIEIGGISEIISGKLKVTEQQLVSELLTITSDLKVIDTLKVDTDFLEEILYTFSETLNTNSSFGTSRIPKVQSSLDPSIQYQPLLFTEASSTGFVRMQLNTPKYGFGLLLYPKVINAIALYNAEQLIKAFKNPTKDYPISPPANEPFTPVVGTFMGQYKSKYLYCFDGQKEQTQKAFIASINAVTIDTNKLVQLMASLKELFPDSEALEELSTLVNKLIANGITPEKREAIKEKIIALISKIDFSYPIECFYDSPFKTFEVATDSKETPNTGGLAIVPSFNFEGQLFIELKDVKTPAEVSFYFELAREYTSSANINKDIVYQYLTNKGWKPLNVLADSTNSFTCSGIIRFNIPSDISLKASIMPAGSYWIAIGVANSPDYYPQTSYLSVNGVTLQRKDPHFTTLKNVPVISAELIKSTLNSVPSIAKIAQPFPSFGGVAAENKDKMYERVNLRISAKDRLVTTSDYYRSIKNKFPSIYYSKVVAKKSSKSIKVYVVSTIENKNDSNAYTPLVSECLELKLQTYLVARASLLATIEVVNFKFYYVQVTAAIQLNQGYEEEGVAKQINTALNIFLSPWITTKQEQIKIDTGLNTAEIASFFKSFLAVNDVDSLSFKIGTKDAKGTIIYGQALQQIAVDRLGTLLVPAPITNKTLIDYNIWRP